MISREEALRIVNDTDAPRAAVLDRAAEIRDHAWSRTITYSRKVFIPLTTLCRDTCGYCIFAKTPKQGGRFLEPAEVIDIARAGAEVGCKEALFSLGERPEDRWPEARDALSRLGYSSTLEYLAAMCGRVLEETGLIPHANPGTLTEDEMRSLSPVTGSMGLMLESVSDRLMTRNQCHHSCPDKQPARRLATLETAGRLRVPFTTGILIGIGETRSERVEALLAIRDLHERWGTIQEVIVQNFRAKSGIAMANAPEPSLNEMLATLAAARLILPDEVSLQAPPNLAGDRLDSNLGGEAAYGAYLDAGINDWGGISPLTLDHINPERAWPAIDEVAEVCRARGFELQERLTVYSAFQTREFVEARVRPALSRLAGSAPTTSASRV